MFEYKMDSLKQLLDLSELRKALDFLKEEMEKLKTTQPKVEVAEIKPESNEWSEEDVIVNPMTTQEVKGERLIETLSHVDSTARYSVDLIKEKLREVEYEIIGLNVNQEYEELNKKRQRELIKAEEISPELIAIRAAKLKELDANLAVLLAKSDLNAQKKAAQTSKTESLSDDSETNLLGENHETAKEKAAAAAAKIAAALKEPRPIKSLSEFEDSDTATNQAVLAAKNADAATAALAAHRAAVAERNVARLNAARTSINSSDDSEDNHLAEERALKEAEKARAKLALIQKNQAEKEQKEEEGRLREATKQEEIRAREAALLEEARIKEEEIKTQALLKEAEENAAQLETQRIRDAELLLEKRKQEAIVALDAEKNAEKLIKSIEKQIFETKTAISIKDAAVSSAKTKYTSLQETNSKKEKEIQKKQNAKEDLEKKENELDKLKIKSTKLNDDLKSAELNLTSVKLKANEFREFAPKADAPKEVENGKATKKNGKKGK